MTNNHTQNTEEIMSEEMKILKTYVIPGEMISKKNNLCVHRMGSFTRIGHKKRWNDFEKESLVHLKNFKPLNPPSWPVYMHVWHYRKTKRMFDYVNMCQGVLDLLQGDMSSKGKSQAHKIIPEDDVNHVIPVHESPFAGWSVDKANPRTVVTFTTDPYYMTKQQANQGV